MSQSHLAGPSNRLWMPLGQGPGVPATEAWPSPVSCLAKGDLLEAVST